MDQVFSSVIGTIIFAAFVGGLANSIGATPFFIIVGLVIAAAVFGTWEVVRDAFRGSKRPNSDQREA